MHTLRLVHSSPAPGSHRVELTLVEEGRAPFSAAATFAFTVSPQDAENFRWYLEDYLVYPDEPARQIAARVEARMSELGRELFAAVFQGNDDTRDLWAQVRDHLATTRVEVIAEVAEATALPWELLRDPKTEAPLALSAQAFVRAQPATARRARLPAGEEGPIRILVVICRPQAEDDVPFRSVASRLLRALEDSPAATRKAFDLTVLRPPTYEALARTLREAARQKRSFHGVHFDGHGAYLSEEELASSGALKRLLEGVPAAVLAGRRRGSHGYLAFENPDLDDNTQFVDGPSLGQLLAETGVPVLVLNACRSAHAETPESAPQPGAVSPETSDPHAQVRAFGSLAQEVMDAGAAGVVAMRYNVFVVTAAQLVGEVYAALARGATLGEAVTLGRKNLADQPLRSLGHDHVALQDWPVPVVWEVAPLRLFPETGDGGLVITVRPGGGAPTGGKGLDPALSLRPDAGFYGRDETLLALDRAFDRHPIVLLHAYAGSGKTSTAAEFARWYAATGGVRGPVLFTSFERRLPLPQLLDRLGQVLEGALERLGVNWLALDDSQRRDVALQVLRQVPVLWIWDNVEPVAGFPAGTESAWTAEEQTELAAFLREARETKAKFLLTSRRDETGWLGDLPVRIQVPPMPFVERLQFARALADRRGRKLGDVEGWRPLLAFTGGNPMAITVLVGQALKDGLTTRAQIEGFVDRLRAGETAFADEATEGRTRSLATSLTYGFEHAFSLEECRSLALLHLFQGFVDVGALCWMGHPEGEWCLEEVRGRSREEWGDLLDRAADVGLLTADGGGCYSIHPALPWFLQGLFEQSYGASSLAAIHAYVAATGALGLYYWEQYEGGNREVIAALRREEANLLHARRLARRHGWWSAALSAMQGLRNLYGPTGRQPEWRRLVEEIVPDFVDATTDSSLPGREDDWSLVTSYRVGLLREERRWEDAERLQGLDVDWSRERAGPAADLPGEQLDRRQRHAVRSLGSSLHQLGEIRRDLCRDDCIDAYREALALAGRIGYQRGVAICAFNLGHAFKDLAGLRDLDKAAQWYRRSLELCEEGAGPGKTNCLMSLAAVARERFNEARAGERPQQELLVHLNEGVGLYHEALRLLSRDDVPTLAVVHNQLGALYGDAGDLDNALHHLRQSIPYQETQGNHFGAAQSRFNVALTLGRAGRYSDGLDYARTALEGFTRYGASTAADIEDTQRLIAQLEAALRATVAPETHATHPLPSRSLRSQPHPAAGQAPRRRT